MLQVLTRWLRSRNGALLVFAVATAFLSYAVVLQALGRLDGSTSDAFQANQVRIPGRYSGPLLAAVGKDGLRTGFGMRERTDVGRSPFLVGGTPGSTGLLHSFDSQGQVVALAFLPKPEGFEVRRVSMGFDTTAVALVALNPGVPTAQPLMDLVLADVIGGMPTVRVLSDRLRDDANREGSDYLEHPSRATLEALDEALQALPTALAQRSRQVDPGRARITARGTPAALLDTALTSATARNAAITSARSVARPPLPRSCDAPGIRAADALEGDDVCFGVRSTSLSKGRESLAMRGANRSPRWVFAYAGDGSGLVPAAMVKPKEWVVPGLLDLVDALATAMTNSREAAAVKRRLDRLADGLGVEYDPHLGADGFLKALQLQLQRFGHDRVSDVSIAVPADRSLSTAAFGVARTAATSDVQIRRRVAPAVLTLLTVVVVPLIHIVLDVRGAREGTDKAVKRPKASDPPDELSCTPSDSTGIDDLLELATDVADPVTEMTGTLVDDSAGPGAKALAIGKTLPQLLLATLKHSNFAVCLLGRTLFTAAQDGSLGAGAKQAADTFIDAGVDSVGELVGVLFNGETPDQYQIVRSTFASLFSSVVTALTERMATRLALMVAPGGQLLLAYKLSQQAPDMAAWGFSVTDLISTTVAHDVGSDYVLDSAADIDAQLATYPREVPDEPIKVPYPPRWMGGRVDTAPNPEAAEGFWVSGSDRLDAFDADGELAYTIEVDPLRTTNGSGAAVLTLVKRRPNGSEEWHRSYPNPPVGHVNLLIDESNGSLFVSPSSGAIGGMKIVSALDGGLLSDVEQDARRAGFTSSLNPFGDGSGWVLTETGWLIVVGVQDSNFNERSWMVNTASGDGHAAQTQGGYAWVTASEGGTPFVAHDDSTLDAVTSNGDLKHYPDLPYAPAFVSELGIDNPMCHGAIAYVADDGLLTRALLSGREQWQRYVDPRQQNAGNRALFSSVERPDCSVVAADDHGVVSKYTAGGDNVWWNRFGEFSPGATERDPGEGGEYPASGLVAGNGLIIVASDQDPHLVAFDDRTGKTLWTWTLPAETTHLVRLENGPLLATSKDGDVSLLETPSPP